MEHEEAGLIPVDDEFDKLCMEDRVSCEPQQDDLPFIL